MADMVLNERQQKLAADNHNLIYCFLHQKHADVEEYYGLMAIALCKAAYIYDERKGLRFSTVAFRCMSNEWAMHWRAKTADKRIPEYMCDSLDTPLSEYLNDARCDIDDTKDDVEAFVMSLPEKQRGILAAISAGYTQAEIAQSRGCTQSYISRIRTGIQQKWRRYAAMA